MQDVARILDGALNRAIEGMVADAFRSGGQGGGRDDYGGRGGQGGQGGGLSRQDFQSWAERQPTLLAWCGGRRPRLADPTATSPSGHHHLFATSPPPSRPALAAGMTASATRG
jgi:hypothetical protein